MRTSLDASYSARQSRSYSLCIHSIDKQHGVLILCDCPALQNSPLSSEIDISVSKLLGFETFAKSLRVSVSVSENLVSKKKAGVRVRKNLGLEKSLGFGFGKIWSWKKSLGFGFRKFSLEKIQFWKI